MDLSPAYDMWTGMLLMGMTYTPVDVVFDTGSDWLAVETFECDACDGNTFNADFSGRMGDGSLLSREYGAITLVGYEFMDQICVSYDQCMQEFTYIAITSWD
jgi:hypothetical protein